MSSREQPRDYTKKLKHALRTSNECIDILKSQNREVGKENYFIDKENMKLEAENALLLKTIIKQKRWWQILIFIKRK